VGKRNKQITRHPSPPLYPASPTLTQLSTPHHLAQVTVNRLRPSRRPLLSVSLTEATGIKPETQDDSPCRIEKPPYGGPPQRDSTRVGCHADLIRRFRASPCTRQRAGRRNRSARLCQLVASPGHLLSRGSPLPLPLEQNQVQS